MYIKHYRQSGLGIKTCSLGGSRAFFVEAIGQTELRWKLDRLTMSAGKSRKDRLLENAQEFRHTDFRDESRSSDSGFAMMSDERFRIFISSPGDVAEERVLANNLVRRLADEYSERLWIEPVFWEHEPMLATSTFQTQIPPPAECEVVVCILWSRLGTRLPGSITRDDGSRSASHTASEARRCHQSIAHD